MQQQLCPGLTFDKVLWSFSPCYCWVPPPVQSYLQPFLSWPACMHPSYGILTFRSVGLGSYLRAHVCHSYPGPLYCVVSQPRVDLSLFNNLAVFNNLALVNNQNVVVVVRLCLRLFVYPNKCRSTYLSRCELCLEQMSSVVLIHTQHYDNWVHTSEVKLHFSDVLWPCNFVVSLWDHI